MADITKSRMRIVLDHPWIASGVLRLALVQDASVPTACTDGVQVRWNPAFTAPLSQDACDGLLAHEAMHCLLLHQLRRDGRDAERWNVACDVVVNHILADSGFALPAGGVEPQKMLPGYAGQDAEWVYDHLPQNACKNRPAFGEVEDAPGNAQAAQARQWKGAMAQVAAAARQAGIKSAALDRACADTVKSPADPREVLAEYLARATGRDDYTFARPARRGLALDLVLPGLHGESCPPIAVCVDTSGSMDDADVARALGFVRAVCDDLGAAQYVIQADAAVCSETRIEAGEPMPRIAVKGGGGTAFGPAIATSILRDVCCIVYITDLYGSFPSREPMIPVVWMTATRDVTPPFGRIVQVKPQ